MSSHASWGIAATKLSASENPTRGFLGSLKAARPRVGSFSSIRIYFLVVLFRYVRVVALIGEAERCEHFLAALTRHHKVATLRQEHENPLTFAESGVSDDLLCIKSPTRYVLTRYTHENANEIPRELDRLGEQEDIDFAVVVGNVLASRIVPFREVYEARLERSKDFEKHFEALETFPEWITLGTLVRAVRSHPDIHKAGAILTFTGTVRQEAMALEFDAYEREAQQRISSIVRDLKTSEGIVEAKIYHKRGYIKRGEDIVYIVVAAAHRQEGFKALRDAIERIKKEVPIWKKEITEQGERWVGL
ncbi:MAG: molybdenum cofactor biosynthesis protein MoaE [Euryarchaeota archaeon]